MRNLATFIEVVHRGTMAAASRQLNITPAAISKQIQSLELELGVQLFKRSTRHIELTSEGKIYFEHAKQILEAYKKAEAALSVRKEEPEGLLRIICGPEFGNLHLLPNLKKFQELYPKLRLHLEFTQHMPDLEKEDVDVVVGLTSRIPLNYVQRSLMHARWTFCASPDYLKKFGSAEKRPCFEVCDFAPRVHGREHEDRYGRIANPDLLEQFQAAHARKQEVEKDDVVTVRVDHGPSGLPVRSNIHGITFGPEPARDHLGDLALSSTTRMRIVIRGCRNLAGDRREND